MEGVAENKAGYFALRAQHSVDDMKGGIMGGGSLPSTRGGRLGSLPSMGYARAGGVRKVRKVLKVTNIGVYATCKLLIYVNIYFIMLKIVFKFNFFT